MKNSILAALVLAVSVLTPEAALRAQQPEADPIRELERLARSDLVALQRIGRSPAGREVVLARVGARDGSDPGPSLLVVAGVRPAHAIGTEVALELVRRLVDGNGRDPVVTELLERVTVYVLPLLNPDAAAALGRRPVGVTAWNDSPYDDDRDGEVDEDGPDDLDGNGQITLMRIADPVGTWMEDPIDAGLMREADPARGESRGWLVMREGVDDDGDGRWNEDPPGGTDLGLNFPRDYEWFVAGAGDYPVSAPEARALAEFLTDRDEIAAIVVIGERDNLLAPWKPHPSDEEAIESRRPGQRLTRPLHSVLEPDAAWYAEISRRYREATGRSAADTLGTEPLGGDPLSWGYYQMGRWAFGSSVWTPPAPAEEADDESEVPAEGRAEPGAERDEAPGSESPPAPPDDDPVAAERRLLRWIRAHRPSDFVEWAPVDHPDFPDRTVEVGGFAPLARWTPPAGVRDSLVRGEVDFLLDLASLLPRVRIVEAVSEPLGDGTYRVTARIANEGFLPTHTALAARLGRPRAVRVEIETGGQEIVGGRRIQTLDALPGSGAATELTWTVVGRGNGTIGIVAGTPSAGSDRTEVTLR